MVRNGSAPDHVQKLIVVRLDGMLWSYPGIQHFPILTDHENGAMSMSFQESAVRNKYAVK